MGRCIAEKGCVHVLTGQTRILASPEFELFLVELSERRAETPCERLLCLHLVRRREILWNSVERRGTLHCIQHGVVRVRVLVGVVVEA